MTAIRGYQCDRCKTVEAGGWATLQRYYGWRTTSVGRPQPFHYCGQCAAAIGLAPTTKDAHT